jgi:hypothetical protein
MDSRWTSCELDYVSTSKNFHWRPIDFEGDRLKWAVCYSDEILPAPRALGLQTSKGSYQHHSSRPGTLSSLVR